MNKIATLFFAAFVIALIGACKRVETPVADSDDVDEIMDSVAAQFEVHDSIALNNSELSIPDFIGFEETFSVENKPAVTKHLKLFGMKEITIKDDSSALGTLQAAWGRGVELAEKNADNGTANHMLRFRALTDEALGLYINKNGKTNSQIFFNDKRLIPVYVRELQSLGYELQADKSTDNMRFYSAKKEMDSFDQNFCLLISEQGCALISFYDQDDDDD